MHMYGVNMYGMSTWIVNMYVLSKLIMNMYVVSMLIVNNEHVQGDPTSFRWPNWAVQPNWFMVGMGKVSQDYHIMVNMVGCQNHQNHPILKNQNNCFH